MTNNWHRFSPIPLRIALGVYLMWVGGPIMLDDASRDSTVYTLTQMGLPWAELLVFVVGAVAFFSGLSFFLGAYTRRVAIVQILSFELYLLFGLVQNGYQVLPGEVFVLPTFSASILVLISLVALAVGGPGAWSYEVEQDTDYDPLGVLTPLRWGVGIYLLVLGLPFLLSTTWRGEVADTLSALGLSSGVGLAVWGMGLLALVAGKYFILNKGVKWAATFSVIAFGGYTILVLTAENGMEVVSAGMLNGDTGFLLTGMLVTLFVGGIAAAREAKLAQLGMSYLSVPIRAGHEEAVRELLAEVKAKPNENGYWQLGQSQLIHDARLWVTDKPSLAIEVAHGGDFEQLVAEWLTLAPEIDALLEHCQDYAGSKTLLAYLRQHLLSTDFSYVGVPEVTLRQLEERAELRAGLKALVAGKEADLEHSLNLLSSFVPRRSWIAQAADLWHKGEDYVIGDVMRGGVLPVFRGFVGIVSSWELVDKLPLGTAEQAVAANDESGGEAVAAPAGSMTVAVQLKPRHSWFLRPGLKVASPLLQMSWADGVMDDDYSLHAFSAAVAEDGNTLWLNAIYHGDEETHRQHMHKAFGWVLDAVGHHVADYPTAGLVDAEALGNWLAAHQVETDVHYRAYEASEMHQLVQEREVMEFVETHYDVEKVKELVSVLTQ